MRSIASCYSEHAVKVSDSYCSGPSSRPHPTAHNRIASVQIAVTCVYRSTLSNHKHLFVTVTWHSQGFAVAVSHGGSGGGAQDPRQFHKISGAEAFVDSSSGTTIEVLWDLSAAQYGSGPEPARGFHLLVAADSEPGLVLGDSESVSPVIAAAGAKPLLISRREHYSGSATYATKVQFSGGAAHDIVIKCGREGGGGPGRSSPVLSVWMDQRKVVRVERLMWNFRGNQTIFVDGAVVDMMWDVHDWFFNPASGYAIFMFRTRTRLETRLWLEENLNLGKRDHQEQVEFSLLICASNSPDLSSF